MALFRWHPDLQLFRSDLRSVHINNSFLDFFHFTLWPAFAYNFCCLSGHNKKPQKNNKKKCRKTIEIFINTEQKKKLKKPKKKTKRNRSGDQISTERGSRFAFWLTLPCCFFGTRDMVNVNHDVAHGAPQTWVAGRYREVISTGREAVGFSGVDRHKNPLWLLH